jgi:peptidoglycan/LPS O-acetylase OafA/YrhL
MTCLLLNLHIGIQMAKKKTVPLVLLLALSLLVGWLEYGPARESQYTATLLMMHALMSLALVFAWFWLDAKERHFKTSILLKIAVSGLAIFALPYYLFKSRGPVGGSKAVCLSLLMFVATMTCYRAGTWLAQPPFS